MKTYPLAEAKAKLSGIVDEVSRRDERVTITKRGRPAVVVMSTEDMESLEATLEIMSDPEFYAEILRNRAALDRGEGITGTLDELFGEEGSRDRARTKDRVASKSERNPSRSPARAKAKGARGSSRPSPRRGRR